jgi:hypothetical protein
MDRRRTLTIAATGALGLSVVASIAAGFQAAPTPSQLLFLAGASLLFVSGSMIQAIISQPADVAALQKHPQ